MKKPSTTETRNWLEEAYPQMHSLLLALDGDEDAANWLAENSPGVALLTRALTGEHRALSRLEEGKGVDLDDLFELIDNEDLVDWLEQRQPNLHLLFEAIQGDDEALAQVRRRKAAYARLVGPFRKIHETFIRKTRDGNGFIEGGTAGDMGCLIGEMHLRQGEYDKAVEAFTRAIETQQAADLYEGRARAYRGLATRDETHAQILRKDG
jgi:tetratricopeptide (TPR) repeat protein